MFRLLKIKSHYEKPSERNKREKDENTRRVKKFKKLNIKQIILYKINLFFIPKLKLF